ncbi:ATP synthase F0 subcomplex A subunit [Tamaricihabitans halophyticus]|uniref:ATP synthase subunit a n=1 Tax=Tamaricihabitans halophyticus TaxID=1262583 RepID=A0A4R2QZJ9_9PSEU|nr:F0F1 ATP synthase subunit A [Tamaricihabitans halophyticus]TCP54814.1 ATP synthase F0 subcomplex A subunit [Tamaricihabitans halophyticus]
MGALVLTQGGGFEPPGVDFFFLPPIFGEVTKPMVLVVLSTLIISVYFMLASRNLKIVPGKGQFVAESIYGMARNTIAREQIGAKDFRPFVPLILGLFTFVLVNNIFGIIPLIQFPTMSKIGFPIALFIVVYVVMHAVGFRRHGFLGYFKHVMFPPGVPKPIYLILSPIEAFQKFIAQPLALAVRVFAAMFAGHMIILVFALGGAYLLFEASAGLKPTSLVAWAGVIAITFVEALIQVLQAYIFALLTANFIGAALSSEH